MDSVDFYKSFGRNVDTTIIKDYRKLCRFCLEAASKEIDENNSELFKLLTSVELISTPKHPKEICSVCEYNLQSACQFRTALLDMEQSWNTFLDHKFMEDVNISEEHIYDEILFETKVESNGKDSDWDTSSIDQLFEPSTVPLLRTKKHTQNMSPRVSYRLQREIKFTHIESKKWNEFSVYCDHSVLPSTRRTAYDSTTNTNMYQMQQKKRIQPSQSTIMVRHSNMLDTEIEPFNLANDFNKFHGFMHEAVEEVEDLYSMSSSIEHTSDSNSLYTALQLNICSTEDNKFQKRHKSAKVKPSRIKCVLVGNGGVGKTNLILSYLENKFVAQHVPTASDIYNFEVKVNDTPVQVTLCDTAGQDSLEQLRQLSYPDCDVFLLCFSVVKPESFHAIKLKWAPTFYRTKASLLLIGTQSDLRTDPQIIVNLKKQGLRPVLGNDAWDLASSIGAEFIETSSRNNLGVKIAFDTAIWNALCALKIKNSKKSSFWKKLICLT